ncbi:Bax inhibitor-1/YccA family protein [Gandjariella thermophila]|uniref:Membrane protein n=1 Tax=Gandjariella thermophila TaxID=1931992 RepID=A0A4D4IZY0_9PSEU|nr:Bax inhibitor-1/YccA family protein [Gandjariella thermophila]GDY29905.1 membrane protein [Gandjariella thermophila]
MRTTGNPAFRNLPTGGGYGGYATFDTPLGAGYGQQARPTAVERPMTIDDVVTKTAITLGLALVTGALTAYFHAYGLALPALLVGLVVSLVIIFRRTPSAPLVLTYAAAEGVLLGAISGLFNAIYPGIALQAILGTFGVFAAMLVVYKTGAVRVTPRLTKWVIGATVGAFLLMLADLLFSLFHVDTGLRDGGPLAIIFSLVVIGIAAFNFLLDFDAADRMIRAGLPAKFAWYAAFGLMTTLVWLYLEILRLLSYLQRQ